MHSFGTKCPPSPQQLKKGNGQARDVLWLERAQHVTDKVLPRGIQRHPGLWYAVTTT